MGPELATPGPTLTWRRLRWPSSDAGSVARIDLDNQAQESYSPGTLT